MASTQNTQQLQKEGRIALLKQAIQNKKILSYNRAAQLYNISRSTLRRRVNGTLPQAKSNARKRKLQPIEESCLLQWILDLNQRGFPPHIIDVRRIAD